MPHVDPDLLATYALGGRLPDPIERHLSRCPDCKAEVAALAEIVRLSRSPDEGVLVPPPPDVWTGIVAATGLAEPPPARARRRSRLMLAAAVAGVIAGAGIVAGYQALAGADESTLVAEAVLDPLGDGSASGAAAIVEAESERRLVVDVDAPDVDGYLEVWLLTPDVSGLVSLGVLTGGVADVAIPDGLDLDTFSVVDVSVEPFDGDPAHSGESLVRGALDAPSSST